MKLFKSVDEKLEDLGFIKTREDEYGASYERKNTEYDYTHKVDIDHKESGEHIILSYVPDCIGTTGHAEIGLTDYETKLFLKKMKQINLYSK